MQPDAMKRISVIVCTRNRSAQLETALSSFESCAVPEGWEAELVVVDNGSTDDTAAIAGRKPARGSFRITVVREPRPGLSCARNAGIRQATGEIIAFTDDDCQAQADWITSLVRAFGLYPDVDSVFGRVEATSGADAGRTVAVKTETRGRDYRYPDMPGRIGHGNNMAFRRQALEKAGPFDEALGAGGPLRAAEDLDMAYRILRGGGQVRYEPSCVILHAPRETEAQVRATHWRNAVGMGACYGKHALHGDLFAAKCLFWMMAGLPASADREAKWLYFWGLPAGVAKRSLHDMKASFGRAQ